MKCKFIKPNGKQCNANAMIGSKFCFSHNPKSKKDKLAAVIKGGSSLRKNHALLPPVDLNNPRDVANLLAKAINETRSGLLQLKIANSIGYLSGHLIKALEVADLEERLSKLEKSILQQNE